MEKDKIVTISIIAIVLIVILSFSIYIYLQKLENSEKIPVVINVDLGKEFILRENQTALLNGTSLQIKITGFINSGCPEGGGCFWEGKGIVFEYSLNGEVKKGVNLHQAFGYSVDIIDSDYKTYAKLRIGMYV